MSLHHSKRTAILQWFNSFSKNDLSKISHLADGKHFCDIICSVFDRYPPLYVKDVDSSSLEVGNSGEPILSDIISNEPIDASIFKDNGHSEQVCADSKGKDLVSDGSILEKPAIEIKISVPANVELDTNSETELYPFDIDTTDSSEAAKIKKEIQNELSKVLGSESDVFNVQENKENKSVGCEKENAAAVIPTTERKRGRPRSSNKMELVTQKNADNDRKSTDLEVIAQRFDFVKHFVDEMFCTDTTVFVDYSLCKESDELELGKVSVLILSLVVRQYLMESSKEKLDTLTLLDSKVQEDIQECLSMLLQQQFSKKDLQKLLTGHAKYKISPRKSPRLCTPVRSHSMKQSSSILSMTVSHEDVFTDSPLKSFLDSPQLKKTLISKDMELVKARKVLHAEEVRSEELQLEVNHLKKKLEEKDKEMVKLKSELKDLKSVTVEEKECEECLNLRDKLKSKEKIIIDLKSEALEKDKLYEEENSKLTHEITMLQGKLQLLKRKQNESSAQTPDNVVEVVKAKDEEIFALKTSNRKLKAQLEEMLRNYSFVHSQLSSSRIHDYEKDDSGLNSVPSGECIGSVIEEENKVLRQKLLQAPKTLEKLLRKWDIKEIVAEDFRKNFNFSVKNDSKLMELSQLSEASRTLSFNDLDVTNLSKSGSFSNLSTTSLATPLEMKIRRQPSRKRKSSCSSLRDSESSFALGSLWAQYKDSTAGSNSSNDIDEAKLSLLKQLGFSEIDYPSKMEVIKKSLSSLSELFHQNGSNGLKNLPSVPDLNQTLKSEEECLKCLLFIKESLVNFNSSTPASPLKSEIKEIEVADSTMCCDNKVDLIDQLQKANEELHINLSKTVAMSSAELDEKITEIRELSSQLEAVEQLNRELSKTKDLLQGQNKELRKKLDGLTSQVTKMSNKVAENEKIKGLYATLMNEKNENDQKFKKQLKVCREKILSFELQKKEFAATMEKEKANMREMATQIELFKNELVSVKLQKKNLEKYIRDLKSKIEQLATFNNFLKTEMKQQKQSHEKIITDYASQLSEARLTKIQKIETDQNPKEVKLEENKGPTSNNLNVDEEGETLQQSAVSFAPEPSSSCVRNSESVYLESCHENSMSTSVFNKSVHHDDEEGFLNYSSIAEIKKDYDPTSKGERLRELKRRNTLYLPHMQSSYPVELQTMSPFNMSVYEHIKKTPQFQKQTKFEKGCGSQLSLNEQAAKKRRITESEQQRALEAGPSSAVPATPVTKARRTFKTPASLKKLLHYRKKLQSMESSKTKH